VGVGLADDEVVAVEHLAEQKGRQVQLQGTVPPAPRHVVRQGRHCKPDQISSEERSAVKKA
jgi:hypothetical protein